MITIIAAASENNVLGKNNELIWHLPNDFKRFKLITSGHYIIMGRKTFESFPKPLPNRTHVIITKQKDYFAEGCIVVNSFQEALDICPKNETIFVIGGGEIYNLAMPFADKIELTRVHSFFEGDAFFPEINKNEWLLNNQEIQTMDDKHAFDFTFETYTRK